MFDERAEGDLTEDIGSDPLNGYREYRWWVTTVSSSMTLVTFMSWRSPTRETWQYLSFWLLT